MRKSNTWTTFPTELTSSSPELLVHQHRHTASGLLFGEFRGSNGRRVVESVGKATKMIRSASYARLRAVRQARLHSREALLWCLLFFMWASMMRSDGSIGAPFGIITSVLEGKRAPGEPPHRHAYLPEAEVYRHSQDECGDVLGIPRVALLFLTTGDLYHESSWRLWLRSAEGLIPSQVVAQRMCNSTSGVVVPASCLLKSNGHDAEYKNQHLFSIYVHAPPSFEGYDPASLWHGKIVDYRVATEWGAHTLVEATRHLLWEAFKDPLNTRFLLLSESDIPIYDPLTMYQQLQAENSSRLDTCVHESTSPWRWHPRMETKRLKFHHWRKSPQWMTLTREHVELALSDKEVYRMFERHCWSAWDDEHSRWHRDCFSDEHYFATLLASHDKDSEGICESRGVSFTSWEAKSAHPKAYSGSEISPDLIHQARAASKSINGRPFPQCNWHEAQENARSLFHPAAEVSGDEALCESFGIKEPSFEAQLPDTCFLTARKFGKDSVFAVKKLFLHCDEDINLISRDVCLKEGGTICNSLLGRIKTIFYKDAC